MSIRDPQRDQGDPADGASEDDCVALLCDRALVGLDDAERLALERSLARRGALDDAAFDLVAARLDCALHADRPLEPMPTHLRATCVASIERLADPSRPVDHSASAGHLAPAAGRSLTPWLGWAIAAVLAIAAVVPVVRRTGGGPPPRPPIASDAARIALLKTDDPLCASASGELVWDESAQRGRLVVTGLEPNDPRALQYQLWIFDATRDERFPVDGGLFDVPNDGRAVLEIAPPVPIREASLFAVTVEPPGGSVVSDRRIVLVGKRRG